MAPSSGEEDLRPAEAAAAIEARLDELCALVVDRSCERRPEIAALYGPAGRAHCLRDTRHHLSTLASTVATESVGLFIDYVAWSKRTLAARGIPPEDLAHG